MIAGDQTQRLFVFYQQDGFVAARGGDRAAFLERFARAVGCSSAIAAHPALSPSAIDKLLGAPAASRDSDFSGILVSLKTILPDVEFDLRSQNPRPKADGPRPLIGGDVKVGATSFADDAVSVGCDPSAPAPQIGP